MCRWNVQSHFRRTSEGDRPLGSMRRAWDFRNPIEKFMKKNMATGDSAGIVLIDETLLKSKVYTIRGVKVLLDADLAKIYGYSTKRFNEQVKANIERFDDDFRFQLTKEEVSALNLRSEKPTSSLITYIVFRKFL